MIDNEAQLAGLAYALIGQSSALTKAEQRLVDRRQDVPASLVNTTRKAIRVGDDPLELGIFAACQVRKNRR